MRFMVNMLIALMVAAILAGVMWHRNVAQMQRSQMEQVRSEVARFQRQILLQSSLGKVELNRQGYPLTIDPAWFKDDLPRNVMLGPNHPWVEIAHADIEEAEHPIAKIATNSEQSCFWYNPYTGRVRARVPSTTSDIVALEMYNFINISNLTELFADEVPSRSDEQ